MVNVSLGVNNLAGSAVRLSGCCFLFCHSHLIVGRHTGFFFFFFNVWVSFRCYVGSVSLGMIPFLGLIQHLLREIINVFFLAFPAFSLRSCMWRCCITIIFIIHFYTKGGRQGHKKTILPLQIKDKKR